MKHYIFMVALFVFNASVAQQQCSIRFNFTVDNHHIELGKKYYMPSIQDSVNFETIKFYLSGLQFFEEGKLVASYDDRYFLLDAAAPASLNIEKALIPDGDFNKIKFNIGIDSLTNVSGAFGADLDPTNGMYWTWQSGYINFKLEGTADTCPARNHRFQYHIGGYKNPFGTLQNIELETASDRNISINVDIGKLFDQLDFEITHQIMSPGQKAVEMAQTVPSIFSVAK